MLNIWVERIGLIDCSCWCCCSSTDLWFWCSVSGDGKAIISLLACLRLWFWPNTGFVLVCLESLRNWSSWLRLIDLIAQWERLRHHTRRLILWRIGLRLEHVKLVFDLFFFGQGRHVRKLFIKYKIGFFQIKRISSFKLKFATITGRYSYDVWAVFLDWQCFSWFRP